MNFDSKKWALSFYGVIDERFEVETDMFQLHIHRNDCIDKLSAKRGEGTLDIFIPQGCKMDRYKNQEQLRRMLLSEVMIQAKSIFTQRTMYYANRYNIPCERVEMEHRYRYIGKCYGEKNLIKYNPWVICCGERRHIDYLVCHELAHFFHNNHSLEFWQMVDRLYFELDLQANTTGRQLLPVRSELGQSMILTILMYWGRSSYLKSFFWEGHVKHKIPLIIPNYTETPNGKELDHIYTTFAIKI